MEKPPVLTTPRRKWRKFKVVAAVLVPLAIIGALVEPPDDSPSNPPATIALTPSPGANEAEPAIDPAVRRTADEFAKRLVRNYSGSLVGLRLSDSTMTAEWSSQKCDYFDGEVIDLLLSINRTLVDTPDIRGTRTCAGSSRNFSLMAGAIRNYRDGRISDQQVLAALR